MEGVDTHALAKVADYLCGTAECRFIERVHGDPFSIERRPLRARLRRTHLQSASRDCFSDPEFAAETPQKGELRIGDLEKSRNLGERNLRIQRYRQKQALVHRLQASIATP